MIKHWKRCVQVAEGELRAGVRPLAPADQRGTFGPVGEVDLAGQFGHPRPLVRLAVLAGRRRPRRLLNALQGLADGLVSG
jgi:hypothetical protein